MCLFVVGISRCYARHCVCTVQTVLSALGHTKLCNKGKPASFYSTIPCIALKSILHNATNSCAVCYSKVANILMHTRSCSLNTHAVHNTGRHSAPATSRGTPRTAQSSSQSAERVAAAAVNSLLQSAQGLVVSTMPVRMQLPPPPRRSSQHSSSEL
jgi:hypothetical protein